MAVRISIRGTDPPGLTCGPSPDRPDGYRNIHAALQRGQEVEFLTPGDREFAADVDLPVRKGRFAGPYVHGRNGDRFLYLSWGEVDGTSFRMFRRGKIRLEHLDATALDGTTVEVRIGLTDPRGHPTSASIGPSAGEWRVAQR